MIADLKAANTRREAESRITADQVAGLKELVPKSLEQWKQNGDARLEELALELQSLKKLLENRVGGRSMAGGTPEPRMPTYIPPPKANGPSPSTPGAEASNPIRVRIGGACAWRGRVEEGKLVAEASGRRREGGHSGVADGGGEEERFGGFECEWRRGEC